MQILNTYKCISSQDMHKDGVPLIHQASPQRVDTFDHTYKKLKTLRLFNNMLKHFQGIWEGYY